MCSFIFSRRLWRLRCLATAGRKLRALLHVHSLVILHSANFFCDQNIRSSMFQGLKTGMYYLRTKAATNAIQFTVDKLALRSKQQRGTPQKMTPTKNQVGCVGFDYVSMLVVSRKPSFKDGEMVFHCAEN